MQQHVPHVSLNTTAQRSLAENSAGPQQHCATHKERLAAALVLLDVAEEHVRARFRLVAAVCNAKQGQEILRRKKKKKKKCKRQPTTAQRFAYSLC
jgi:hypothetical protein